MYYHAKVFTATVAGKRIKEVSCEKCLTGFSYELLRVGTGRGSAPYWIGQAWAKKRAEKGAQKNLARRLERDVELVPCPACRWVNADAIQTFRKSREQAWTMCAWVMLILAFLVAGLLYFEAQDIFGKPPSLSAPEVCVTFSIGLMLAGGCKLIQAFLRKRINPNVLVNGMPNLPAGTPPALMQTAGADGVERVVAVPSENLHSHTGALWATVRPGQLVLEPMCCDCLMPTKSVYKLPMTVAAVMKIPMCAGCLRVVRKKFWLHNLAIIPLAAIIGSLCGWLPDIADVGGRVAIIAFVAGFIILSGFVVIDRRLRPYRMKVVDETRGIKKIWFKNPAYTALLIRRIGEADGIYDK